MQALPKNHAMVDGWGWALRSFVPGTLIPKVRFSECPIKASLGVLGRKWTMLILRDIGLRRIDRFNRILESVPGLTPRVLSMRLNQLRDDGFIEAASDQERKAAIRWTLTEKGRDALPILIDLIAFGSKWYPDAVFKDKRPRRLNELFNHEALRIIQRRSKLTSG